MRPTRPSRRGQWGFTLIEMVVAISVILIGVVGVSGSFVALEQSSGIVGQQTQLEVAMRQLSDFVRSPVALPYHLCAAPGNYNTSLPAVPSGVTSWSVTAVQLSLSHSGSTPFLQDCGSPNGVHVFDWGVQEVDLSVVDGTRSLSRVVWKGQA